MRWGAIYLPDQTDVELDEVRSQGGEQVQRAVACVQVVEGRPETSLPQETQYASEVPVVIKLLAARHFEDYAVGGEPVLLRRRGCS